jgi:hypothetical protein
MAIGELPSWIQTSPNAAVAALEAGARTGLAASEADQRAMEEAQQLAFSQKKLATDVSENALERQSREKLTAKAQAISQNRFDTQTNLDRAQLALRNSALQLQTAKQAHLEQIQKENNIQKSSIDADASEFWKDSADGTDPKALADKHPLALKRRDIQQYLAQQAQAARVKKPEITQETSVLPSGRPEKTTLRGQPGPEMDAALKVLTKKTGVVPMPSDKSKLVTGQTYSTPKGNATWDGEKFVKAP